jgi:hypothetical protein
LEICFASSVVLDGYSDLLAKSYSKGVAMAGHICCDVFVSFMGESSKQKNTVGKGA